MRISDWSSDVCSSDLIGHGREVPLLLGLSWKSLGNGPHRRLTVAVSRGIGPVENRADPLPDPPCCLGLERTSVEEGKSASVRVALGGRRSIKHTNNTRQTALKRKHRHTH